MGEPIVYYCEECGRTKKTEAKEILPIFCCDKKMREQDLNICTKSGSAAEHARFIDDDEPCDEGR